MIYCRYQSGSHTHQILICKHRKYFKTTHTWKLYVHHIRFLEYSWVVNGKIRQEDGLNYPSTVKGVWNYMYTSVYSTHKARMNSSKPSIHHVIDNLAQSFDISRIISRRKHMELIDKLAHWQFIHFLVVDIREQTHTIIR